MLELFSIQPEDKLNTDRIPPWEKALLGLVLFVIGLVIAIPFVHSRRVSKKSVSTTQTAPAFLPGHQHHNFPPRRHYNKRILRDLMKEQGNLPSGIYKGVVDSTIGGVLVDSVDSYPLLAITTPERKYLVIDDSECDSRSGDTILFGRTEINIDSIGGEAVPAIPIYHILSNLNCTTPDPQGNESEAKAPSNRSGPFHF